MNVNTPHSLHFCNKCAFRFGNGCTGICLFYNCGKACPTSKNMNANFEYPGPFMTDPIFKEINIELNKASKHGEFQSLHEAYAVLLEELDEVWEITRLKKKDRQVKELYAEFIQVAAMAIKAIHAMHNFVGGNV